MKLSDFAIGRTFRCAGKLYRCTDVGTRGVVAIKLEAVEVGSISDGSYKVRVLDQRTAEANGWFNGPPYAVQEVEFDENDMEGCKTTRHAPRRLKPA